MLTLIFQAQHSEVKLVFLLRGNPNALKIFSASSDKADSTAAPQNLYKYSQKYFTYF
jgi:hypothetical protein